MDAFCELQDQVTCILLLITFSDRSAFGTFSRKMSPELLQSTLIFLFLSVLGFAGSSNQYVHSARKLQSLNFVNFCHYNKTPKITIFEFPTKIVGKWWSVGFFEFKNSPTKTAVGR